MCYGVTNSKENVPLWLVNGCDISIVFWKFVPIERLTDDAVDVEMMGLEMFSPVCVIQSVVEEKRK